jgi:hypothetical protein
MLYDIDRSGFFILARPGYYAIAFAGGIRLYCGRLLSHFRRSRIIFYELGFEEWMGLSAELESLLIIQAVNPPYNVRIPARE